MSIYENFKKRLLPLLLVLITFIFAFLPGNATLTAYAEQNTPIDVISDLSRDESFNIADYPSYTVDEYWERNGDFTLPFLEMINVIQVAESNDQKLFIYAYHPIIDERLDVDQFNASAISMSYGFSPDGQDLKPVIYNLKLVSQEDVFAKYVVENFKVPNDEYRYYNIVAIYKYYDDATDKVTGGSVPDSYEIGVNVGQQWCACTIDGVVNYKMGTFETVEIDVKYTGNVFLKNGFSWEAFFATATACHSWFVAFDIEDYIVKYIYDADLSYTKQVLSVMDIFTIEFSTVVKERKENIPVHLTDVAKVSFSASGWFGGDFCSWNRIMRSSDYLANFEKQGIVFNEETKKALENSQWVFSFVETPYSHTSLRVGSNKEYTDIEDVTILKLHFIDIFGRTYNLGAVSDRTNPDNLSDGSNPEPDWWKIILAILILVLIIAFCPSILLFIGKFVVFVVTLPIRAVSWLIKAVNKKKKRRDIAKLRDSDKKRELELIRELEKKRSSKKRG